LKSQDIEVKIVSFNQILMVKAEFNEM